MAIAGRSIEPLPYLHGNPFTVEHLDNALPSNVEQWIAAAITILTALAALFKRRGGSPPSARAGR